MNKDKMRKGKKWIPIYGLFTVVEVEDINDESLLVAMCFWHFSFAICLAMTPFLLFMR